MSDMTFKKIAGFILLGIFLVVSFMFPGKLFGKTHESLDSVSLTTLKEKCSLNPNFCYFQICEEDSDCEEFEKNKWLALKQYAKECEDNKEDCDALQKNVWEAIEDKGIGDSDNGNIGGSGSSLLSKDDKSYLLEEFIRTCSPKTYHDLSVTEQGRLIQVATSIGSNKEDLAAVISFESAGTFCPCALNKKSYAVGLIQFMPKTAVNLGTTSRELCDMTFLEQLDYVEDYFNDVRGSKLLKRKEDLYMAVLWPSAIGEDLDYEIFNTQVQYEQNKNIDIKHGNGDGKITVAEASTAVFG